MVVTQVAYEVEGWGVGELWFEGPRVVWHDLPFPRATARTGNGGELVERLRAYFAGRPDSFEGDDDAHRTHLIRILNLYERRMATSVSTPG